MMNSPNYYDSGLSSRVSEMSTNKRSTDMHVLPEYKLRKDQKGVQAKGKKEEGGFSGVYSNVQKSFFFKKK